MSTLELSADRCLLLDGCDCMVLSVFVSAVFLLCSSVFCCVVQNCAVLCCAVRRVVRVPSSELLLEFFLSMTSCQVQSPEFPFLFLLRFPLARQLEWAAAIGPLNFSGRFYTGSVPIYRHTGRPYRSKLCYLYTLHKHRQAGCSAQRVTTQYTCAVCGLCNCDTSQIRSLCTLHSAHVAIVNLPRHELSVPSSDSPRLL
jgi:hypothetical protein